MSSVEPGGGWTRSELSQLAGEGLSVSVDAAGRAVASTDFGNLVRGEALAIVTPRDKHELARALAFANERRLSFTARGTGRSSGGQSVAKKSVTLELSRLDRVEAVDAERREIRCEPGARWRAVVEATLARGLVPRVLPLNLDLTVGGTISVGGVGSTSHRFGTAAANVAAIEAVTGDGRLLHSADEPELLAATLAGLGRAAVITSATLALRPAPAKVHTYYLLYDEFAPWLADLERARNEQRFEHVDGFCSANVQGLRNVPGGRRPFARWFYGLHLSVEHDGDALPDRAAMLAGLQPRWCVHEEENGAAAYAARADPRFEAMAKAGAFALPHPWLECLVPFESVPELLPRVLEMLPLVLGDGHRVALLAKQGAPPLFALPDAQNVALIAVLPMGVPPNVLADVLPALRAVNSLLLDRGGKRYLAGWLELDEAGWRAHYGDRYAKLLDVKRRFDPNGVLRAACF
jgi:cytokinin dehydrogenase